MTARYALITPLSLTTETDHRTPKTIKCAQALETCSIVAAIK